MGVAALAALAAVLWIATALTPLPAVAAVGATAVTGACAVGFGYLRREVAKADAVDRQTVADIDAELGPRRAHGRRRAVDIVRARTLAQARREAARGSSSHGSSDAEEIAVLQEKTRWVPVTERLPEVSNSWGVSDIVLCIISDPSGYPPPNPGWCVYLEDGRWTCHGRIVWVTHWMPLPEGPEEVE